MTPTAARIDNGSIAGGHVIDIVGFNNSPNGQGSRTPIIFSCSGYNSGTNMLKQYGDFGRY
jgi:hypothetical protein